MLGNGKKEKRMFNWDLVYKDGEEWSFEEIRAKQRGLYGKEWRGEVQEWESQWHKPGCESLLCDLSVSNSITSFFASQAQAS